MPLTKLRKKYEPRRPLKSAVLTNLFLSDDERKLTGLGFGLRLFSFFVAEPIAQSAEQQPFKLGVAGSNPAGLMESPSSSQVKDTGPSSPRHRFKSGWGR